MRSQKPDWFLLINAWLGRGRYGLTLPFLVGAIAYHRHKPHPASNEITALVNEIINNPVRGYIVHIRWCAEYGSAVFAVYEEDSPQRVRDRVVEIKPTGIQIPSVAIERNLATVWKVPAEKDALLGKLVDTATEPVISGNFSRNWTQDGVQYQPLQPDDIRFINETLG